MAGTNVYSPGHGSRNFAYNYITGSNNANSANDAYSRMLNAGAYATPSRGSMGGVQNANYGAGLWGGGTNTGNQYSNQIAQNYYNGGGGQQSYSPGSSGGGSSTPASYNGNYSTSIEPKEIWNSDQIQSQVNNANASIRQQAQAAKQKAGRSLASRGFGPGSGLSAALSAGLDSNAAANMAKGENDIRWGAAGGNASHLLQGQQARAQEGLGLANLLQQQRNSDNQLQLANTNRAFSLLSSML